MEGTQESKNLGTWMQVMQDLDEGETQILGLELH